jgi:hypothetical protein
MARFRKRGVQCVLLVRYCLQLVQACGTRVVLLGVGRLDSADEGLGLQGEAVRIGQRLRIARCDRHPHGKIDQAIGEQRH